jgi:hypothetical protein
MQTRQSLPLLTAIAFALLGSSALAWNDTGHKTIALIAWEDLTPAVQVRITALLRKHPQYSTLIQAKSAAEEESQILDFMNAATWADQVRTETPGNRPYNHPEWHLTVFPFITGSLPADKRPAPWSDEWKPGETPDNIMRALKKNSADAQDPKGTDEQKAVALTWLEHLTGDIHQPLHSTSWYSEEHPDGEGDKRGNYTYINTGGSKVSLHTYWDGGLPQYSNLNASRGLVAQLKKEFPRSGFADQLKETDFKNWALDSHELCKTVVYMNGQIPHGVSAKDAIPVVSRAYQDEARALGRKRVTLAGYRLADQLNRLFGTELSSPNRIP